MQNLDIERYLEGKGYTLKRASANEVHTHCFFHDEPKDKRGRLYINVDPTQTTPGLFKCHYCGEQGWAKQILEYFGDTLKKNEDTESVENLYSIFNEACEYYHQNLLDNSQAIKYLKEQRGLTQDTIEKFRLGWADGLLKKHLNNLGYKSDDLLKSGLIRDTGHDFLYQNITIPYLVAGNVVQIRGKDPAGKYFTPPGNKARLFNSDATWGADRVVLCEGEFDAMIADQLGYNAVGVPGANTWQDSWTGYLTEVNRVYIVFDADTAGASAAAKLAETIGHARPVTLPVDGADLSDWVNEHGATKADLDELLDAVKSELLVTVEQSYEEWLLYEGNPNRKGLLLGVDAFDRFIKPGFMPAQIMVMQAKTGVGKTLGLLNFFEMMSREQPEMKILFLSLEQTRNEWFDRAWRIHRFYEMIQDRDTAIKSCIDYWHDRIRLVDKNRVTTREFRQAVEEHLYDFGNIDLIAVDYLGYWARSFKGEQYQRTTDAIMMLKELAKEWKIPIMAPHQVARRAEAGKEPDISDARDSGAVEETADFLLSFWAPDDKRDVSGVNTDIAQMTGDLNMRILKSRHGGKNTMVQCQRSPYSLVIVPKDDAKRNRLAANEFKSYQLGDDYETAFQRHFTKSKSLTNGKS